VLIPLNAVGLYTWRAQVDVLNRVPDTITTDDTAVGDMVQVAGPELSAASVVGPTAAGTGDRPTVSVNVENPGSGNAGAFRVRVELVSSAGTVVSTGVAGAAGVTRGATVTVPVQVFIPLNAVGLYTWRAQIDILNQVPDTVTTDDGAVGDTVQVAGPELAPALVVGPSTASPGSRPVVSVTVENPGSGNADGFRVRVELVSSTGTVLSAGIVDAGGVTRATSLVVPVAVFVPLDAAGPYTLRAQVDILDQVPDTITADDTRDGNVVVVQ
jgi:hypothetical protein